LRIREFMKKQKIVVTVCCIAALIGGAFIYGAVMPETAQAKAADRAEHIEADAGKEATEKDEQKEEKQEMQDKAEKEQQGQKQSKSVTDQEKSTAEPSVSKSSSSGGSSGGGQSRQESPAAPTQPAHTHKWDPVKEMQEVQEKKAVYGDKCSTCNEDITGRAEEHILESNCMGYLTDVFIRYDYETVKKEVITGYECNCGARK